MSSISGTPTSSPFGGSSVWYLTGNCFTAGTQVVVGAEFDANDIFVQYITVKIEDIQVGDLVYSYDTITGEVSQQEVTAVFEREVTHINYLTVEDEYGNIQVIEVTDVHPFWVVTDEPDLERAAREFGDGFYHANIAPTENGFWVEAKDLLVGDVFIGANGELSTLVGIERVELDEPILVYNFSVAGNHNYFVIAADNEYGQTSVLVHNAQYTNPQWHHLLPHNANWSHLWDGLDIHSAQFGIILEHADHAAITKKWNDEWAKFFDQNKKPNQAQILAQLYKMKNMDEFKNVLSKGTAPPVGRYNAWSAAERAKLMKSNNSTLGKVLKVGKRVLKMGLGVGLIFLPGDIQAKGWRGGIANTALDMTPGVGAGKFAREIYDGKDLIPDKPTPPKP